MLINETTKPRSHLAFIHSPPPSVNAAKHHNGIEEQELVEHQLNEDYCAEEDFTSMSYEVNCTLDKIKFLQLQDRLDDVTKLRRRCKKKPKHVREIDAPQSMDYTWLCDPLCDMNYDDEWQQRRLNYNYINYSNHQTSTGEDTDSSIFPEIANSKTSV